MQQTKDMGVEKGFIKEKIVAVIVEMAVQDWPQQWKNFLELLVQIAAMGVKLVIRIISHLIRRLGYAARINIDHLAISSRRDSGVQ